MKCFSLNAMQFVAEGGRRVLKIVGVYVSRLAKEHHIKCSIGGVSFRFSANIEFKWNDKTPTETKPSEKAPARIAAIDSRLDREDIARVAALLNRLQAFRSTVTEGEIAALFDGIPALGLTANRIDVIVTLFSELRTAGLVGRYWQTALARQGSILQYDGIRAQTSTAYSSALYRARKKNRTCPRVIKELVGELGAKHDALNG